MDYTRYDLNNSSIEMFTRFTKSDNEKWAEKVIPNFNELSTHYWRKLLRFKILRCCFDGTDDELKRVQNYWNGN